jgi:uncharacterized oligopeptide transporter (OPT) family protein
LWSAYIRYIGAGAVLAAGLITLGRTLPTIVASAREGLKDFGAGAGATAVLRTERDIPTMVVLVGSLALALFLWVAPGMPTQGNLLASVLVIIFGFLFVTVSSRITGLIGTSSNPISGMTIATLILTCLLFVGLGWTGDMYAPIALCVGAVVCIAAANAGGTSQDLKTGYLVGSTPKRQQIAILVGALASALVVGWTLTLLNRSYTYPVPERHPAFSAQALQPQNNGRAPVEYLSQTMGGFRVAGSDSIDQASYQVARVYVVTDGVPAGKYLMDPITHELRYVLDPGIGGRVHDYQGHAIPRLDSPKATIMALITDGILTHKLPWGLVLLGVFITVAIELMGVQALPVAVGVYLPISTSSAMFAGGIVRWLIERRAQAQQLSIAELESGPGVLFSSGLIAGGAICGIVLAAIAGAFGSADALAENAGLAHALGGLPASMVIAYLLFALMGWMLYRVASQKA